MHAIAYNWKTVYRIKVGFSFEIIGLNELRISLTNTTHVAITVFEISEFELCQLGSTVFLAVFNVFHGV